MNSNSIKINQWRAKINHIFYIKLGSIIQTVYYLIRYKFNTETIHDKLDRMIKDVKYDRRKMKENHIKEMSELEKRKEELEKDIDEKIRDKRL